jgi:hypothetical protein
MPHSEVNAGNVLGEAVNILRTTVSEAAQAVKLKRESQGTLFMEKEWWRLAPMVTTIYYFEHRQLTAIRFFSPYTLHTKI